MRLLNKIWWAVSTLESKTESDAVDYAVSLGCLTLKLNVLGRKGWPDRLFVYRGSLIFIEFKREGKDPRKLQEYVHEKIREHGFEVYVIDKLVEAKVLLYKFVQGTLV